MGTPERETTGIDAEFHQAGVPVTPANEPMRATPSRFRFHPFTNDIPQERISAVLLVPFLPDGKIVVVQHTNRGIDIPGGHREIGDRSDFETARREFKEETGLDVGQMIPYLLMESDEYRDEYGPKYMVVMAGIILNIDRPFPVSNEVTARHFLSPETFLQVYNGNIQDMRYILSEAEKIEGIHNGNTPKEPDLGLASNL